MSLHMEMAKNRQQREELGTYFEYCLDTSHSLHSKELKNILFKSVCGSSYSLGAQNRNESRAAMLGEKVVEDQVYICIHRHPFISVGENYFRAAFKRLV